MVASALAVGCLLMGQASNSTPPDHDQSSQVRRLVLQLDDDLASTRQAAQEALIAMGPDILDALPPAANHPSPEVKERLGRVWQSLETELARQAVDATRVSLSGEMSSAEAFQSVQQQTGNRLAGYEDQAASITMACDETPFWLAVDRLMDQCNLTSNAFGNQRQTLSFQPRPEGQSPRVGKAAYHGIFRIEATQVSAVRDLRNPGNGGMRVRLGIEWEPRITPISLSIPMSKIAATDGRWAKIPAGNSRGTLSASVSNDFNIVEIDLPLGLPDRGARQIGSLSGELVAMIPGRVETFEFELLEDAQEQSKRRAGVAVTLKNIVKNEDVYEIRIRVQFDNAADALESHRGWVFKNEAYLVDGEGKRIENDGLQTTFQGKSEVGVSYLFALDSLPSGGRFIYKTPALIVSSVIPFELQHIKLP